MHARDRVVRRRRRRRATRSWWTKPCERKRPSRRWTKRCSRCRCTAGASSEPWSANTTGRIGCSRRHSQIGCPFACGARSVSSVCIQDGSALKRSRQVRQRELAVFAAGRQRLRAEQLQAARDRLPQVVLVEPQPVLATSPAGPAASAICRLQLAARARGRLRAPPAPRFLRSASSCSASIACASAVGVPAREAVAQPLLEPALEHRRQAAELLADRSSSSRRAPSARGPPAAARRRSSGSGPRPRAAACGRCGRCAAPAGSGSTARRSGRGRRSGSGGSRPRARRRWRSGRAADASPGRR